MAMSEHDHEPDQQPAEPGGPIRWTQASWPGTPSSAAQSTIDQMTDAFLKSAAGQKKIQAMPQKKAGEPSDLDGTLLLLASRKASRFMTGSIVVVDGGHLTSFT